MTYNTSNDYERLWELLMAGVNILFRWAGRGQKAWQDRSVSWGLPISEGRKEDIIDTWKDGGLEFIDPASQQSQNLWHGPEERPESERNVLFVYKGNTSEVGKLVQQSSFVEIGDEWEEWDELFTLFKRWAYVDELIKATGGNE